MNLNQNNLHIIKKQIDIPLYTPSHPTTAIVHIGVGGFHRSHQAYYIHRLLDRYPDWAICGIGLREADRSMSEVMNQQDCLYTLVTQYPDGNAISEVIGSITEYLLAVDKPDRVIDKMAHFDTKIVSLTITEGGYNFNPITEQFDFDNPDIQHELNYPDQPRTIYGYITAALRNRRNQGLPPFTILSCDNIQHNGDMTRKMLMAFAKKQDSQLAAWIETNVSFPNSMVDRITPVTTPQLISLVKDNYDYTDRWPVVCEPYIQWIIEDNFVNGRPPLEEYGVQFVPDVTPYEKMKIRLLNAGHSVLGIPGAIQGYHTIDTCMDDPVFVSFLRLFMDIEVSPILDRVPGINLEVYKDTLEARFANSTIKDTVSRICSESSAKLPKFLIPTILENLENRGSIKYATFILAAWSYYSAVQTDLHNNPIDIIDSRKGELHQSAIMLHSDPLSFLRITDIFGSLIDNQRFVSTYTKQIEDIYSNPNMQYQMESISQADNG